MDDKEHYKRAAGREQEQPESTPPKSVMSAELILFTIGVVLIAGLIAAGAVYLVEWLFTILGIR